MYPYNNNARYIKSSLLHEFVYVYLGTANTTQLMHLIKKWTDMTGWKINSDGKWSYDIKIGGTNYYLEKNQYIFQIRGKILLYQ